METSLFSSAAVDNSMKEVNAQTDIPESLVKAYTNMMARGLRVREVLDGDYQKVKGTGKFEHLDKLDKGQLPPGSGK